jgi:hypothetical protein
LMRAFLALMFAYSPCFMWLLLFKF